jgi:tetratricopeptide (TPR) repeat protein
MKITSIQTSNFIGARSVEVKLTKPVALFAGKNYAGKSSLQEAVRMALTGESVRVSLKKDYENLITDGQDTGFAEVVVSDRDAMTSYSIVLPSGKGVHSDIAALPYVLDAQRFAHMSADERRSFLFGLMGVGIKTGDIEERMRARGCNNEKASRVAPYLRAGFEAAMKEAQAKARDAKASWKTTTGGETYGAVKAASWMAVKPEVDTDRLENYRSELKAIEHSLEVDTARFGELQGRARHAAEQAGKLEELRENADRFARIQEKLNRDEEELKEWQEKVRVLRDSRLSQDGMPCPSCGTMLVMKDGAFVHAAPMDSGTEGDIARLPEYEKAMHLMENAVANGKRDLAEASAAAAAMKGLENVSGNEVPTPEVISKLKGVIDENKADRTNIQQAIRVLEDAANLANQAEEKTCRAAQLHKDVQEWDAIAEALSPNGIQGEMLAEALGPINERLFKSADIAEWRMVVIDAEMQISIGEDGADAHWRPYALLSESEKWRTDAMIAEAIAYISGIRLVVLDRFDVLDLKGREDLLYWLDALAIDGDLDCALVFGTLKGIPAQLPDTVCAHWIEDGVSGQMKEAA